MEYFNNEGIRQLMEKYGIKFENWDSIKILKVRFEVILKDGKEHVFKFSDFDDYSVSSCNFCTYLIALKSGILFDAVADQEACQLFPLLVWWY